MDITLFASGSTGNCALLSAGGSHLLIDGGLSARRIREALGRWGLTPSDLAGVVVTHAHSDHICGLGILTKQNPGLPLFASRPTARALCWRLPVEDRTYPFEPGDSFSVGGVHIDTIPTSHDTPGSVGYRFTDAAGRSACVVTDLGVITDRVCRGVEGVDLAVLECNHDPDMLRSGPYPPALKLRIAGPQGHLSNQEGARLCVLAAETAHTVVLAHLSQHNNTPRLALETVRAALADRPDVRIAVAPVLDYETRFEVSP